MSMGRAEIRGAQRGGRGVERSVAGRFAEPQGHPVAFANRLVPGVVGRIVAVGRRQRPHAVRMIGAVLGIGVDLAARIQLETGARPHRLVLTSAASTATISSASTPAASISTREERRRSRQDAVVSEYSIGMPIITATPMVGTRQPKWVAA